MSKAAAAAKWSTDGWTPNECPRHSKSKFCVTNCPGCLYSFTSATCQARKSVTSPRWKRANSAPRLPLIVPTTEGKSSQLLIRLLQ
ncbi:hypothetical protein D3C87_1825760 [compost metagenome]